MDAHNVRGGVEALPDAEAHCEGVLRVFLACLAAGPRGPERDVPSRTCPSMCTRRTARLATPTLRATAGLEELARHVPVSC